MADPAVPCHRLVAAHRAAVGFFAEQLTTRAAASPREYLRSRGFGPLLSSGQWELGYAPASWTALASHLRDCGFDDHELIATGLAIRARSGDLVDRFRDRVMLPVRAPDGQRVGFVGRAAPNAGHDTPKYLNSPRAPLFNKSALLFGLSEQHDALTNGAVPVIVEGPFDALAVSLAQTDTSAAFAAVAPCGTALTTTQASLLARFTTARVLIAYDADQAGQRASAAAYDVLASRFDQLRSVVLPDGCDPAVLLQTKGPRALRDALAHDRPLADAVVDHGLRYWLPKRDNAEARAAAVRELATSIARLRPDDVTREAGRLAQAFGIDHAAITEALTDAVTTTATALSTARRNGSFSTPPIPRQRLALSLDLS